MSTLQVRLSTGYVDFVALHESGVVLYYQSASRQPWLKLLDELKQFSAFVLVTVLGGVYAAMALAHVDENFNHPYQPYDIQLQFMRALYDCIEGEKVGIFESPTEDGDPEWMVEHARVQKRHEIVQRRAELETRLESIRRQERKAKEHQQNGQPYQKRRKLADEPGTTTANEEDQFILDDYESDDGDKVAKQGNAATDLGLSKETRALMEKLGMTGSSKDEDVEPEDELKIYFCSRTHSQLTQFVGELRRIKLPGAIPVGDALGDPQSPGETLFEELKHLTLGSRKNLCINAKVSSLKSPTAINERCIELQEAKTPADKKCSFVPNKDNEAASIDFRNHALAKIRDIEELGTLGKKLGVCPYYATRPTVKPSEIVTLPYPLLLQKSAREALGLSLKNHVVIIDEAHNLMDAIMGIYTVEVSLDQLQMARQQLTIYLQKFRNRLKGKNRVYVAQLVRLIDSLISHLQTLTAANAKRPSSATVQAVELLKGKGVDQINLYKLMNYLQESKLARKVEGYMSHEKQREHTKSKSDTGQSREVAVPVLSHIQSLLYVLTNPAREGRLFHTSAGDGAGAKLKYLLLDPSEYFREIVEDARAVILAGGTMSPMDDYLHQLFPYLDSSRITTLSCGHVIPASNLFVSPIAQTPNGADFDFTFASRNSPSMISQFGETVVRLLPSIPDGTVIFFPSYAYLDQVTAEWKKPSGSSGSLSSIWARVEREKPIFTEAQSGSGFGPSTEDVLAAYSAAVHSSSSSSSSGRKGGALLLAVIGGKLSEGINFSDALGRCVVVVGLPYPNPHSPEWKARMEYIEQKAAERRGGAGGGGDVPAPGTASREFAENVCMRAVNQAIGRAVRHKADWASILLVDRRYGHKRIMEKLPKWIQASLPSSGGRPQGFAAVENGLRRFYAAKREEAGTT
ncbi:hypothetical protein MBLNU459_g6817t1 [Dothideomycetes sp. NU459]